MILELLVLAAGVAIGRRARRRPRREHEPRALILELPSGPAVVACSTYHAPGECEACDYDRATGEHSEPLEVGRSRSRAVVLDLVEPTWARDVPRPARPERVRK